MTRTISAADANRMFSRLLREVRAGKSYIVTSHGQPVARIVPADEASETWSKARSTLLTRLRRQRPVKAERWTREELYERGR